MCICLFQILRLNHHVPKCQKVWHSSILFGQNPGLMMSPISNAKITGLQPMYTFFSISCQLRPPKKRFHDIGLANSRSSMILQNFMIVQLIHPFFNPGETSCDIYSRQAIISLLVQVASFTAVVTGRHHSLQKFQCQFQDRKML